MKPRSTPLGSVTPARSSVVSCRAAVFGFAELSSIGKQFTPLNLVVSIEVLLLSSIEAVRRSVQ